MDQAVSQSLNRDLKIREMIRDWLLAASYVDSGNVATLTPITAFLLSQDSVKIDALAGNIQALYETPRRFEAGNK